ncbi:MAG: thioredoxin family protein [Mycoplasma sp.]|nr:thioredoxin family protein [Candidatus Hennigella equi]
MIIDFKKTDDINFLMSKYDKILIDIYATWCGPCKMLAPQLEEFAKSHNDWTIIRVDSDANNNVAAAFNVQAVPTMVIVIKGKVAQTIVGFKPLVEIEKITSKY